MTIDTSYVQQYFGNIGLLTKTPFKYLLIRTRDPKFSFPHKDKSEETADLAVLIALYDND